MMTFIKRRDKRGNWILIWNFWIAVAWWWFDTKRCMRPMTHTAQRLYLLVAANVWFLCYHFISFHLMPFLILKNRLIYLHVKLTWKNFLKWCYARNKILIKRQQKKKKTINGHNIFNYSVINLMSKQFKNYNKSNLWP